MGQLDEEQPLAQTVIALTPHTRSKLLRHTGGSLPLLGHQDEAVDKGLSQLQHEGGAGVVCVPTGGGKTRIGAEIAVRLIAESGYRVLWLAHKNELVDQAVEGLVKVATSQPQPMSFGRFQAGERKVDQRVSCVVASIATLVRNDNLARLLRTNPRFDLVVVDECHHTVARTWRKLVADLRERVPSTRLLGLSATPFRTDQVEDKVLRHIFGDVVLHEVGATELIEAAVLARPSFVEVDTDEVLEFAGDFAAEGDVDFTEKQLRQIADRQARNKLMVDVYLSRRQAWGPTVFFACTIAHCEQIAAMLQAAGIERARAVHGDTSRMSKRERDEAIRDFKEGKLDVLVSAMLLTEGTDLPKVRSVFMARPTRSPILFRQMIGRGLRGPRVGGTTACNLLLFRDTFADHAAAGLSDRLSWLAGLDGVELALEELDRRALEADLAKAMAEDPVLAEVRRAKRERIEQQLTALVADAGLEAEEQDRRLDGWWELRVDPDKAPLVLPRFHGFEGLGALIDALTAAISEGRRFEVPDLFDLMMGNVRLFARAWAFAKTALRGCEKSAGSGIASSDRSCDPVTMQQPLFDLPPAVDPKAQSGTVGTADVAGGRRAAPRVRSPNRGQIELRSVDLESMIAPDHRVRVVWDFVVGLDLDEFYARIRAVEGGPGRDATDPQVLLALWLYATLEGVGSARALDRLTTQHDAYRWICGGVPTNYHTLADFRVKHADLLDRLLTTSVATLLSEGLVDMQRVAQDGIRIRASAGAASFRRRPTLEESLRDAEQQLETLRRELDEDPGATTRRQAAARERACEERKERIKRALAQMPEAEAKKSEQDKDKARTSTTDPEARVMKMADGGFRPAYNGQFAVDTATQIVVGVDVSNQGSDAGQMSVMLDQLGRRYDQVPKEYLVDGGFAGLAEIQAGVDVGTTIYAPVAKPRDPTRDRHTPCPGDTDAVAQWRTRMGTDEARETYKERAATVECVNALVRNRGLTRLGVRGTTKARAVLLLQALAHNLLRAVALCPMPRLEPI